MGTSEYLVNRIASGETLAEQELVNKYWKSLFFILKKQTDDDELANDISQDTFIIVIDKIRKQKIENHAAIGAFIRQTGVNLLIAHFRKEARRKTDNSDSIDLEFPDESQSALNSINSKQLVQIVQQVMDELPAQRDKDILYRYFVYGQSKKLICDEFQLTSEHFDRVLYRARNRLTQIIQLKLGVDLNKSTVTSLLSLALTLQLSFSAQTSINDNFFQPQVREISMPHHLLLDSDIRE